MRHVAATARIAGLIFVALASVAAGALLEGDSTGDGAGGRLRVAGVAAGDREHQEEEKRGGDLVDAGAREERETIEHGW